MFGDTHLLRLLAQFEAEPAQSVKVEADVPAPGIPLPPIFPVETATRSSAATAPSRPRPAAATAPTVTAPPADPNGALRVLVITRSGRYVLPGSRYYGKTKEGASMKEDEARAKGYVPAT